MTGSTDLLSVTTITGDNVARVAPTANLRDVSEQLTQREIGLAVVGEGDRPTGVVSERDVVRAVSEGRDPATTTAADIESTSLVWVDAEATVAEVAEVMMENYVRHVLVEEAGRLVGIVSARDVLGVYATS